MKSDNKYLAQCGLLIGLLPVIVIPVWAAGGVYRAWQWPLIPLAFWAWCWFWIVPGTGSFPSRKDRLLGMMKSPVVWFSVLFLAYLALQTWNNGRIRTFDFENNRWAYSPPPHPHLPGSFTFDESFEMIRWFFPALTVWLILNWIKEFRIVLSVCMGVVAFSCLNAVVSILHLRLGWDTLYNSGVQMAEGCYGSFGYPNHAASYFVMMFGLGLGLLSNFSREWTGAKNGILLVKIVLIGLAALGSFSRFSIFSIPLLCLLAGFTFMRRSDQPESGLKRKLLMGLALIILLIVSFFNVNRVPEVFEDIWFRFYDVAQTESLSERIFTDQVKGMIEIWAQQPFYGTGGWGGRYLLGMYVSVDWWAYIPWGYSNIHNDPVQFLAEFGLVGCGLLLGVFAGAVWTCIRDLFSRPSSGRCLWTDPLRLFCWVALTLVCAQSLIDFPFRSPAILINAVLLLHVASTRSDGAPPSA